MAIGFSRFDQRIQPSAGLSATHGIGEQPILALMKMFS
jgi:hypothetical protein